MNARSLAIAVFIVFTFSSCAKVGCTNRYSTNYDPQANIDDGNCIFWSDGWLGTYNGSTTGGNNVNRVVINRVNENTVKMELQTNVLGSYYTYATIGNGNLASVTTVSISEDGTVTSYSGNYRFTGGGTLNGNALTLTGAATQAGQTTLY